MAADREPESAAAGPAAPTDGDNPTGVITPPSLPGEPPATIEVEKAPGKDKPMEVVMAAEVLRRVNRTRQCVSLVSQVIIRSYDEEALHAEACRHLVAFGGYLMAWIGVADEEPERIVRPVAHAGLEPNFLSALHITWSDDLANHSPTSRAIQEQRPHVARNILKEPRFAVLRKEAKLYGYTATCALPLQFAQYGMGVLTIHALEPDAFNAEEVSLLRELANDLAAGIISLRERGKRGALEGRLMAVIDASDDAIIGCDLDALVTDWNAGATRMFGYARNEAVGHPISKLISPEETQAEMAQMREAVANGERPARFETVRLCKEGKTIHTSVMMSPIYSAEGKVIG
ncbi:MAG: PAS domain-containing protein, partial [Candidatus Thermoplasmatota archaeon]